MKKTKQIGIAPAIKNLEIDKSVILKAKYSVISSTIQRIQNDTNMQFTMKKNNGKVKVTRVK